MYFNNRIIKICTLENFIKYCNITYQNYTLFLKYNNLVNIPLTFYLLSFYLLSFHILTFLIFIFRIKCDIAWCNSQYFII